MTELKLTPQIVQGYSVTLGRSVDSVQLDGGMARYRKDIVNPSAVIAVNWTLTGEEYTYLMAFYRGELLDGALSFTIKLAIEGAGLSTYTVHFVPNGPVLNRQEGDLYYVSASLEAQINTPNYTTLASIVSNFNASH